MTAATLTPRQRAGAPIFRLLAQPVRLKALRQLQAGPASPVQIANAIGEPLGTTAYHVRVLHDHGLIQLDRERRVRGAVEHIYRVDARVGELVAAMAALERALAETERA